MDAFNTYKKGADLQFMVDECLNRGKVLQLKKDETLERAGEPARWIGFIKSGYLKYVVTNPVEEKAYNTGFVFEGELVADYPNCLYGVPSDVTIVAGKDCTLMVIEGESIQRMYEEDPHLMNIGKRIGEGLFLQTYTRFLNFYRTDAQTRYEQLLQRCPNIVQKLPLQEIASYLRVTPTTVSKIRKELLEKERG